MTSEPMQDGRERIERARRPELVSAYQTLRDVVFARDSLIPYQLKRELFTISSIPAGRTPLPGRRRLLPTRTGGR